MWTDWYELFRRHRNKLDETLDKHMHHFSVYILWMDYSNAHPILLYSKIGQSGSVLICGSIYFMYKVILGLGAHVVFHSPYFEINHHMFSSSLVMFVFGHLVKTVELLGSTMKVFFCTSKILTCILKHFIIILPYISLSIAKAVVMSVKTRLRT